MGRAAGLVLVVDDDADILEALDLLLTHQGYQVATASDGADALAQLRALPQRPCLILLDLMMPRMDGFQMRAVLAESELSSIPVVALSGAGAKVTDRARSLQLEVLPKPVGLNDLLSTVRRFCTPG
jgi:CheY-like chemotaxis protein